MSAFVARLVGRWLSADASHVRMTQPGGSVPTWWKGQAQQWNANKRCRSGGSSRLASSQKQQSHDCVLLRATLPTLAVASLHVSCSAGPGRRRAQNAQTGRMTSHAMHDQPQDAKPATRAISAVCSLAWHSHQAQCPVLLALNMARERSVESRRRR
jgi:hypothetical protein